VVVGSRLRGTHTVRVTRRLVIGAALVFLLAACSSPVPTRTVGESVAPTPDSPEPSASMLPDLGLPGTSAGIAGEYGWTGPLGSSAWMHHVVQTSSSDFRQTQLTFAVIGDCFGSATAAEPELVTVAGLDGLYLEPYRNPNPAGPETTGTYALPVDDRTLCVYLTWDPATTQEELEAARQVVESIRGQPFGPDGIRINFTLPSGWDTEFSPR
jgi:hypothetical protein